MEDKKAEFSLDSPRQKGQARRPLAERMRPRPFTEVLGQAHILGEGCLLPNLIQENRVVQL